MTRFGGNNNGGTRFGGGGGDGGYDAPAVYDFLTGGRRPTTGAGPSEVPRFQEHPEFTRFAEGREGAWNFVEPTVTAFQWLLSPVTVWGVWGAQAVAHKARQQTAGVDLLAEGLSKRGIISPDVADVVHTVQNADISDFITGNVNPIDLKQYGEQKALENIQYLGEHPSPAFSSYTEAMRGIWPEPEDIGYASAGPIGLGNIPSLLGAIRPIASLGISALPDEPQDWDQPGYSDIRSAVAQMQNVVNSSLIRIPNTAYSPVNFSDDNLATTLVTTLLNEQMTAEIINDPLVAWEAFKVGQSVTNVVNRGFGSFRKVSPTAEYVVGGLQTLYEDAVSMASRRVYRVARPLMSEAKWNAHVEYNKLLDQNKEIVQSMANSGNKMTRTEQNILWEEMNNAVETVPEELFRPYEEFGEAGVQSQIYGTGEAELERQLAFAETESSLDYVRQVFPEMDNETQLIISRTFEDQWRQSGELPELLRLAGVPVENLMGDAAHVIHSFTKEARDVLTSTRPDWEDQLFDSTVNVLGRDLVAPSQKRSFRGNIRYGNDLAARGDIWAHNGRIIYSTSKKTTLRKFLNQLNRRGKTFDDVFTGTNVYDEYVRYVSNEWGKVTGESSEAIGKFRDVVPTKREMTRALNRAMKQYDKVMSTQYGIYFDVFDPQTQAMRQAAEEFGPVGLIEDNYIRDFILSGSTTRNEWLQRSRSKGIASFEDWFKKAHKSDWQDAIYTNTNDDIIKRLDTMKQVEIPEGAVRINKLFNDNMFQNAHSRYVRAVRSHSAASFMKEASGNAGLIGEGPNAITLSQLASSSKYRKFNQGDFNRTFGALGDELQEIATTVKWKDAKTAEGVMEWASMMMDVTRRPAAYQTVMDNIVSAWRALTLSPFLPYHMRNMVGGVNNVLMSGKADIFDVLDAIRGVELHPEWMDDFNRSGGNVSGEISQFANANTSFGFIKPYDGTYGKSYFNMLVNPTSEEYLGKTVGTAIENHQRLAMYFGARKRGHTHEQAMDFVYEYLFDYADIPAGIRHGTWGRRAAAFPVWTMKNIPLQLRHMWQTPVQFGIRGRAMAQYQKAANERIAPEYIEEQQGFAIPGGKDGQVMYFTPENYDPAASIAEWLGAVPALAQDDKQGAWDEVMDMIQDLLNPFVTYPFERLTPYKEIGGMGEPSRTIPMDIIAGTRGEASGWGYDRFRQNAIVQEYRAFNPILGGGEMSERAQQWDYGLRKFFRAYNEGSRLIREGQRMTEGEKGSSVSELVLRSGLGIPIRSADAAQTIYFNLKDNEIAIRNTTRDIRDASASPEQLEKLKGLYFERLADLGHRTFLELDPFTGEPRPWKDKQGDGPYTSQGMRDEYREYLQTTWLLLYGRRSMEGQAVHQQIDLTEQEEKFLVGMLDAAIKSYMVIITNQAEGEPDINVRSEAQYAQSFYGLPEPGE